MFLTLVTFCFWHHSLPGNNLGITLVYIWNERPTRRFQRWDETSEEAPP
jgi:hypothetical protein